MNAQRTGFAVNAVTVFLVVLAACCLPLADLHAEDAPGKEMVECDPGAISVSAIDVKSEDLIRKIGETCGIKMVAYGEVFSDVTVSLQFERMPLRQGLERVLRATEIANHMMHFEDTDNGSRVVEIDLIGKKGGERYLTKGSDPKPPPAPKKTAKKRLERVEANRTPGEQQQEAEMQEGFLKIMDEILKTQLEGGEEPDPAEVLKMFKEVVPDEMKSQIPPEVLEELERLEQ